MTQRIAALVLTLSAALPVTAGASELRGEIQALREYCRPDIERLCPDVMPGEGRIKDCLYRNRERMSVGCAKALKRIKDIRLK